MKNFFLLGIEKYHKTRIPTIIHIIFERYYYKLQSSLYRYFLFVVFVACCVSTSLLAQQNRIPGAPITLQNAPQRDTGITTNSSDWQDEKTVIYFQRLHSQKKYYPDSTLHSFHRRSFLQPWYSNTGNSGSPVINMFFTPEYRTGPTLGYHAFDPYRFILDSLYYYNTTRPYSEFSYQLGSKAEQQISVLHTQNISPHWNFSAQYRKINSPGFYKIQRTTTDNGAITTNYHSPKEHYRLNASIVYNKEQNDENGGIVADSFLSLDEYDNRQVIPVRFQDPTYSNRRSPVTNLHRDAGLLLQHSYTIGKADTTYNEDSTQFFYKLIPKFRITHRLQIESQKQQYKDYRPDSLIYLDIFQSSFPNGDSVFTAQKWFYIDNALLLNGFIGKEGKQLEVNGGIGIRSDRFTTEFATGETSNSYISNYLTGSFTKEALQPKQWSYNGFAKFYFTGQTAGSFLVNVSLGKDISKSLGAVNIGFQQELNNAPYNYTIYRNAFYLREKNYNKESITRLFATWNNAAWKLSAGVRNYLIANYIYIDASQNFNQYATAFNLTQFWLGKRFKFGIVVLDNEVPYQQKTTGAPVNVPTLMGKHKLSIETFVFKRALQIATGVDARYHTPYESAGYSAFFNRFYYQDAVTVSNVPEVALFFNFKVKNFRAYIMADQMQQLFVENNITAPNYPAQNFMIRFGFNWVMIN